MLKPRYEPETILRDKKTGRKVRVNWFSPWTGIYYLAGVRGKKEWFDDELDARFGLGFPYNKLWQDLLNDPKI